MASISAKLSQPTRSRLNPETMQAEESAKAKRGAFFAICFLLGLFGVLQLAIPLSTAIQIGADEGFNLSKALLSMKGYRMYTDVWSDQPPFHTFVIAQLLEHVSGSVLMARAVTVVWAAVLLFSFFLICLRVSGLFTAAVATALLIFSF